MTTDTAKENARYRRWLPVGIGLAGVLTLSAGVAVLAQPTPSEIAAQVDRINVVSDASYADDVTVVPQQRFQSNRPVVIISPLAKIMWTDLDGRVQETYFIDGVNPSAREGDDVTVYVNRYTGDASLTPWKPR